MRCHRCGGIMIHECFYGLHDRFWGWKCVICGDIIDDVILENRRGPKAYQIIGMEDRRRAG